eukprot:1190473-Pyramimonas_sp.AAC.2
MSGWVHIEEQMWNQFPSGVHNNRLQVSAWRSLPGASLVDATYYYYAVLLLIITTSGLVRDDNNKGYLDVVIALLEAGADADETDAIGSDQKRRTPLGVATEQGHLEVKKALWEAFRRSRRPLKDGGWAADGCGERVVDSLKKG